MLSLNYAKSPGRMNFSHSKCRRCLWKCKIIDLESVLWKSLDFGPNWQLDSWERPSQKWSRQGRRQFPTLDCVWDGTYTQILPPLPGLSLLDSWKGFPSMGWPWALSPGITRPSAISPGLISFAFVKLMDCWFVKTYRRKEVVKRKCLSWLKDPYGHIAVKEQWNKSKLGR